MVKQWLVGIFVFGWMGLAAVAEPVRVLLIGNSYTQQIRNQLGEVFAKEASFTLVTPGGYTLQRHAKSDSKAMAALRDQGPWDVVVLQEQSQLPSFVAVEKGWWDRFYTQGAAPLIEQAKKGGARVVLYQTWARRAGDKSTLPRFDGKPAKMQDALSKSYARAAKESGKGVAIAPVGEAFRAALAKSPTLELHAKDGSHPGTNGRYLAALVLYEAVMKRPSVARSISGVPAADRQRLRGAVRAGYATLR